MVTGCSRPSRESSTHHYLLRHLLYSSVLYSAHKAVPRPTKSRCLLGEGSRGFHVEVRPSSPSSQRGLSIVTQEWLAQPLKRVYVKLSVIWHHLVPACIWACSDNTPSSEVGDSCDVNADGMRDDKGIQSY
jgi:hypothetical protein